MRFTVATHRASYREEAEDRALALRVGGQALIVAVADGGGAAAERTIETVRELGPTLVRRGSQAWLRLLSALDDALVAEGLGQTTLVVLCITPRRIVGASVGNSEAWWVGSEGHFDLTEAQKRTSFLGSGEAEPCPFELKRPKEGTLLVATDGLFKYVDPLTLTDAVRAGGGRSPETLQKLVESPRGRLYDDLAIVTASADRIALWTGFLNRFKAG